MPGRKGFASLKTFCQADLFQANAGSRRQRLRRFTLASSIPSRINANSLRLNLDAGRARARCVRRGRRSRQLEGAAFETAIENRQAVAGEEQHLHRVVTTIEEQKQSARLDLPAEFLLHDSHQAGKTLPHVGRLRVGVHLRERKEAQHAVRPLSPAYPLLCAVA